MKEFEKFFILSEESEERIVKMSEEELNMISSRIAHAMRETQYKIEEELNGKGQ